MEVNVRAARNVRAAPGRGGLEQWWRYSVIAVKMSKEADGGQAAVHHWRNCASEEE